MDLPQSAAVLVDDAIASGDVHCAAAVYEVGDGKQQAVLRKLMFEKRRDVLMLARWEHTPSEVLRALCESSDEFVRLRLGRNQNTPVQVLAEQEQTNANADLTGLIAQHQHAPHDLLQNLAEEDEDAEHLKSICRNQASDAAVLMTLSARKPGDFEREMVGNPNVSADMLQVIYRSGDAYLRAAAVGHANCPLALMHEAMDDKEVLVQRQLAKDARLPAAVLMQLATAEDTAVRAGAAGNPALPAEAQPLLAKDEAVAVRRALAARTDLAERLMEQMSTDKDDWVRQWLGRNPALPQALMRQLAEDKVDDVRRAVARNPQCPLALLRYLANDKSDWVRAAVAYQPNADSVLMRELAADTDIDVLSGVAANANTAVSLMMKLARHEEADVRRGVILNPQATRLILVPLLEDPYYLHRLMLVGHAQLTAEDKWRLHDDPDYRVRFSVYRWFAQAFAEASRNK